jgi:hypothetical protein
VEAPLLRHARTQYITIQVMTIVPIRADRGVDVKIVKQLLFLKTVRTGGKCHRMSEKKVAILIASLLAFLFVTIPACQHMNDAPQLGFPQR